MAARAIKHFVVFLIKIKNKILRELHYYMYLCCDVVKTADNNKLIIIT